MPVRKITFLLCASLLLAAIGCMSEIPITGRRQLSLVPASSLNKMALSQYADFLKKHELSTNRVEVARVRRVGERIRSAVEMYFRQQGQSQLLDSYDWKFNLVEDKQKNAWCMPGGRVVVFTGILPTTRDDTGLAVVMAHEIAHAVAEHGKERMSQQLLVALGGVAMNEALKTKPQATKQLFMLSYGAGSTLGVLRYGRVQETEADQLGLYFMAMAGYDPRQSIPFWERMQSSKSGPRAPEFLSTHPYGATRIRGIEKHMPKALDYYKNASKAVPDDTPKAGSEKPLIQI